MERFGSLKKEDGKNGGNITRRKQVELLDHRGKVSQCFLYKSNHFIRYLPLNK